MMSDKGQHERAVRMLHRQMQGADLLNLAAAFVDVGAKPARGLEREMKRFQDEHRRAGWRLCKSTAERLRLAAETVEQGAPLEAPFRRELERLRDRYLHDHEMDAAIDAALELNRSTGAPLKENSVRPSAWEEIAEALAMRELPAELSRDRASKEGQAWRARSAAAVAKRFKRRGGR